MILQRLVEHYDRLTTDPESAAALPRPGYSLQKISFCVVLETDGTLQQFQSTLDSGKKTPLPRRLLVPGQAKSSGSGINPCFLWDNAAYMLGFKRDDPKPQRTLEAFEAFRQRHLAVEEEVGCPAFSAVCAFLRGWSPEKAASHAAELADITGSFGVFRIAGQHRFVHEDPAVVALWAGQTTSDDRAPRSVCLATGEEESIARLHEPKIKGVRSPNPPPGGGFLLVSFNDEAYQSYGKEQSYNAPVSVRAAFKYTNALNHLLGRENRRVSLGDATIVFWAERPTPLEEFVSELWGGAPPLAEDAPPEDKRRAEQVRVFLSQLREGHAGAEAIEDDNTRFYVLGLSPNASRLSVRFWADTTVGEMKDRLAQHLSDVELAGVRPDAPPTIGRIIQTTGRAETNGKGHVKYDPDAVPPLLAGSVARAVLTGGPYPQMLLVAMINRLRADGAVSHPRVAAIKACLVRNSRLQGKPKEVPVALDTNRTEPSYVTGRLFALLEKIQSDSSEGVLNSTIKDRYFSAASSTPAIVFPRLIRLGQHHLAKMKPGQKVYYEKQLGEVMNKLDGFARHLNLEDQGLFTVGYFHQRQDLFTSKKDKGEESE